MTRRQVLQQLAVLVGGAISRPVFAAALEIDRAPAARDWVARTLSPEQSRLVTAVAELILPATDTPGATEAGVPEFIDLLLSDWLDAEDRGRFLDGLAELEAESGDRFGRSFLDLDRGEQISLLGPLDEAAIEVRLANAVSESDEDARLPFFGLMKEMTLVGYYTSEIGLRQELRYRGFTGSYDGCVPLAETA